VALEVHANPGRVEGGALRMELPAGSPYFSPTHGVDKAAVVRAAAAAGRRVAFAGDGFSDAPAARLVPPGLRFARANLALALRAEGLAFRPFERWSEVAAALVAEGEAG
jgi:2-hydroxy-3-keto-5-methylthiopentenyl-1-phosphate phosphatase